MEQFVVQGNIDRFEEQLARASDPKLRRVLESLLEAEKAKLAALLAGEAQTPHRQPQSPMGPDKGHPVAS